jgi:hypothetical protein
VLVDIASRVFRGDEIPLGMGHVNVIWQGDANRVAIECLRARAAPPFVVKVTGTATLSVRSLATWFGERFGKSPRFAGSEGRDALLSNASQMAATFGEPEVDPSRNAGVGCGLGRVGRPAARKADKVRGARWPVLSR